MTHDELWQEWNRKGLDALAVFDVDANNYYAVPPIFLRPDIPQEDILQWINAQDRTLQGDLTGEYRRLQRELHPDTFQASSPELAGAATKLFTNVATVYGVLTDPVKYQLHEVSGTLSWSSPMMDYVQHLHVTTDHIHDHPARRDIDLLLARKAIALEDRTRTDAPAPERLVFPHPDAERYQEEAATARREAADALARARDYEARLRRCSDTLSRYEILGSPEDIIRLPELIEQLKEMGTLRTALQEMQDHLGSVSRQLEEREAAIALFVELTSGKMKTPPYGLSIVGEGQAARRLRNLLRKNHTG